MLPAPLAVQLYSFRAALAQDYEGTIARIGALGFQTVEAFAIGRDPREETLSAAKRLRGALDASGMTACSAHVRAPLGESAPWILDAAAELEVPLVVISSPGAVPGFDANTYGDGQRTKQLGHQLRVSAQNAAERGLRLAFHNHWQEFGTLETGELAYDVLLDAAGGEVEAQLDVFWAQAGGQHPSELVRRLGDRIRTLHIKDGDGQRGTPQVPVGAGTIDNRGAIEAGDHVDYHIIEFDRCATDIFQAAKASADSLVAAGLSRWDR